MKSLQPRRCLILLAMSFQVFYFRAQAQNNFTLQQAIDYALDRNVNVRNAKLDAVSAEAKIGETKAAGLPQVNASVGYTNALILQKMILPANTFDPSAPSNADPIVVAFGIKQTGNLGATWNQLIFNGSYFVGLRAAATYRELAQKGVTQSKVSVAEAVSKAYYSVLVASEQAKVIDLNLARLDTMLSETKKMNAEGFVEKIDVDRIEVQLNNLKSERQKVSNLIELSYALLKFQMAMPQDEPLSLTDTIQADFEVEKVRSELALGNPDFNNRIEYSLLTTQFKLADLDLRNVRAGYLPTVSASLGYGYNNGRSSFGDLFSTKWFNNAALNLNIQIPVFDGLNKHYQIQQKKIALDKVNNTKSLLEQSIALETKQANTNLINTLETLGTLKRNVDLATEVVRVTRIKFKEGVGSNIEVINAESSLKEAQTNYFASLYDLLLAKVDLQKARGELYR